MTQGLYFPSISKRKGKELSCIQELTTQTEPAIGRQRGLREPGVALDPCVQRNC